MKLLFAAVFLCLFALSPAARADVPDDQYINIYHLIQQGDALKEGAQPAPALAKYTEAQTALKQFQFNFPDWNIKVVTYRLNYLSTKITETTELTKKPAPPIVPVIVQTPGTNAPVVNPPDRVPTEMENQLRDLQGQLRRLEADNTALAADRTLLEAKLREALSVRPAALDPKELARAEEQMRELLKENDLLRVTLDRSKSNRLQMELAAYESRQALDEANRKAAEMTQANVVLAAERDALQARVTGSVRTDPAASALREENDILKKQMAELKLRSESAPEDLTRKLREAQSKLAALQSDTDIIRLEKIALQNRVKQMSQTPAVAMPDPTTAERIKKLEADRDGLQQRLDAALKELAGRKKSEEAIARVEELTGQLSGLKARLEIFEAKAVPYTAEELALISRPEGTTLVASASLSSRRPSRELPGNGPALLTEARRFVSAHELEKAEEKYKEILKLAGRNVSALAELASIQVDMNHVADAESNIKAALAIEPRNDYCLFVMGRLRFKEGKFDEALDTFSQAAQLNPDNAETQNYLGITLSEKGLRVPAETALRRAVLINPEMGSAHVNLAFVYVTADPPLVELARWHYQKAIASGHPRSPELEKRLNISKSPGGGQ